MFMGLKNEDIWKVLYWRGVCAFLIEEKVALSGDFQGSFSLTRVILEVPTNSLNAAPFDALVAMEASASYVGLRPTQAWLCIISIHSLHSIVILKR